MYIYYYALQLIYVYILLGAATVGVSNNTMYVYVLSGAATVSVTDNTSL